MPPRWLAAPIVAAAALGMIASHFILALWWLSAMTGPVELIPLLKEEGWTGYYRSQFEFVRKLHPL